jgi:hypothetical protein
VVTHAQPLRVTYRLLYDVDLCTPLFVCEVTRGPVVVSGRVERNLLALLKWRQRHFPEASAQLSSKKPLRL